MYRISGLSDRRLKHKTVIKDDYRLSSLPVWLLLRGLNLHIPPWLYWANGNRVNVSSAAPAAAQPADTAQTADSWGQDPGVHVALDMSQRDVGKIQE